MYQVYNMGHRMEVYCPPSEANSIIATVQSFGIDAQVIGETQASQRTGDTNHITIESQGQTLEYGFK